MEQEGHATHHDHAHQHHGDEIHAHAHAHHAPESPAKRRHGFLDLKNNIVFAILVIAILGVSIYARLGLIKAQGLFEPDGFFYYSIVRATINNHLLEPQYLGISGFPWHNFIGEAPGLPYLTVIFYLILGWSGVGYLSIMRLLPVFFGIVEIVLAYFIAEELSDSRLCGLLAMLFVGVSAGDIARTAALVYRGDTFITVPLMFALLIMLKGIKKVKNPRMMVFYALFAAFVLSTGALIWNGSPFIIAIYMFALVLLMIYSFIAWKPELSKATLVFTAALIFLYLLQVAYVALGGARTGLILQGNSFLAFYIPVLIGAIATFWLTKRGRIGIIHSPIWRAIGSIIVILVVMGAVALVFRGYVGTIAAVAGVTTSAANSTANQSSISHAVGATTQELQKPSFSFLFASFELGLYLMPIGVIMCLLLLTGVSEHRDGRKKLKISAILILLGTIVLFAALNLAAGYDSSLVLATVVAYLLILLLAYESYRSGATIPEAKWVAFMILFAYLAITTYLQYNAIRYNSILSIPLAIFAAYGLYIVIETVSKMKISSRSLKYLVAVAVTVALVLIGTYWLANIISTGNALHNSWYLFEGYASALAMVGIFAYAVLPIVKNTDVDMRMICILATVLIILFCSVFTILESYNSAQADGINPSFLSAMVWLKNNTATNATVLALWPDGSVVEGWANRTSYMDSVGGENGTRIYYFARYLANGSADSQYLYGIGKPEYLIARQYWMTELSGLLAEGEPANPQNYTYTTLGPVGQPTQNATSSFYFFGNGYYNVTLVGTKSNSNASAVNYTAYLGTVGQGRLYKIDRVTFYNSTSYAYRAFNASSGQLNYTLMIFYSGQQIQSALIMTDTLYSSNLFKLVWLCNQYECPYDNATARISPIYINNDTRIFRISYANLTG